jgi:hypothetical protein
MTTTASEPVARAKLKEVIRPCHAPFALGLLMLTLVLGWVR